MRIILIQFEIDVAEIKSLRLPRTQRSTGGADVHIFQ